MHKDDIGGEVKVVKSLAPAARSAGAVNGAVIDVRGFNSAILHVQAGAETGTPTGRTLDSKVQGSLDGSTGWADLVPSTPYPGSAVAAIAQITAVNTERSKSFPLEGVNYIRETQTPAFTGGTAPTLLTSSEFILGAARSTPV